MRIEAYTQVQQIYNTNSAKKSQGTTKAKAKDEVQLSSFGKDLQTAKQAVAETPDVREELMNPIKKAIADGSYEVNAEEFAEKLMAQYREMR
ncbi:MAG: flagellar biosynthesis anti-sigma factor FlgM [Clostridiales bacterium]|nr:flagellar biosynthesis anti-sigma factor FlgM [Clostridiales bacterium]